MCLLLCNWDFWLMHFTICIDLGDTKLDKGNVWASNQPGVDAMQHEHISPPNIRICLIPHCVNHIWEQSTTCTGPHLPPATRLTCTRFDIQLLRIDSSLTMSYLSSRLRKKSKQVKWTVRVNWRRQVTGVKTIHVSKSGCLLFVKADNRNRNNVMTSLQVSVIGKSFTCLSLTCLYACDCSWDFTEVGWGANLSTSRTPNTIQDRV